MKITIKIFSLSVVLALSLLSANKTFGQKTKTKSTTVTNKEKDSRSGVTRTKSGTSKRKRPEKYWIIGIGWNVVDDDGSPFRYLFNAPLRWNVRPYPTRLTVEKYLKKSFSIEGAFNFNQYRPNKIINHEVGKAGIFISTDLNFKNDINKIIKVNGRLNPYIIYGLGATLRTVRILPFGGNFNIGLGTNIWLTRALGINIQSIAKFAVSKRFPRSSANYLQHSLSIVIKLQKGGKNPFIRPRYKWVHRKNLSQERSW